MQHLTYLAVLLACLLGTAPLEFALQARVYRRWRRAAAAILPVAAVFVLWDYLATAAGWWWFDDRYLIGVFLGPASVGGVDVLPGHPDLRAADVRGGAPAAAALGGRRRERIVQARR